MSTCTTSGAGHVCQAAAAQVNVFPCSRLGPPAGEAGNHVRTRWHWCQWHATWRGKMWTNTHGSQPRWSWYTGYITRSQALLAPMVSTYSTHCRALPDEPSKACYPFVTCHDTCKTQMHIQIVIPTYAPLSCTQKDLSIPHTSTPSIRRRRRGRGIPPTPRTNHLRGRRRRRVIPLPPPSSSL